MSLPGFIDIDDSRWPLVVIQFVGAYTARQYEDYLQQQSACLHRREKYISIIDTSRASSTRMAEHRARQIEWIAEHERLLHEYLLGNAFVITSPVIRLAVSIILYFHPMPMPHIVIPNMAAAMEWVLLRLEDAGLHEEARQLRHQSSLTTLVGNGP